MHATTVLFSLLATLAVSAPASNDHDQQQRQQTACIEVCAEAGGQNCPEYCGRELSKLSARAENPVSRSDVDEGLMNCYVGCSAAGGPMSECPCIIQATTSVSKRADSDREQQWQQCYQTCGAMGGPSFTCPCDLIYNLTGRGLADDDRQQSYDDLPVSKRADDDREQQYQDCVSRCAATGAITETCGCDIIFRLPARGLDDSSA